VRALTALRRRRGLGWAVVAGLLALAALAAASARGGGPPGERVLVATAPIPAGTVLDEEVVAGRLGTVEVPGGLPLEGLVRTADDVLGARVAVGVASGEPVTRAALGGSPGTGPRPLAPGERAAPVPLVSAASAAAGLRPGARVDVVASTGEGPAGRSRVVVADAEVLALDAAEDGSAEPSVMLRVGAGEALRLTAATNFAREVRLLVRPAIEPGPALREGSEAAAP
jgi:Flp pilus assembly protein CpaB